MSEENANNTQELNSTESAARREFRRKRVKRIKAILIFLLVFFLVIPNILCAFLLYKLYQMNKNIDLLREEIKISQTEIERRTQETGSVLLDENGNPIVYDAEYVAERDEDADLPDAERYPGKQLVYLTFDDGPSKYTDEILDILKEHDVKATFFVLAQEGYDDQYNRIIAEGHTLGMHSYTHKYSEIYKDLDSFKLDIVSLSDFLIGKTGIRPRFYRFPGGSSNDVSDVPAEDMIHFLTEQGYVYYDWNVTSEDASSTMKDTNVIVRNVLNGIGNKSHSVVLMHDAATKRTTVEALPIIIESLQKKDNVVFLPITDKTEQVYHVKPELPQEEVKSPEERSEDPESLSEIVKEENGEGAGDEETAGDETDADRISEE